VLSIACKERIRFYDYVKLLSTEKIKDVQNKGIIRFGRYAAYEKKFQREKNIAQI
jgi:hypothetical protein